MTGGRGEMVGWEGEAAMGAGTDAARDRLVVTGGEDLHVLGRFFRAMLLALLKDPRKVRALEGMEMVVAVDPPAHPGSALTLDFHGGRVALQSGVSPRPDIVLECEAAVLMRLARVPPGPAAIKFLLTNEGKALLAGMRSGELKIRGAVRHPLGMMRFAGFLAPGVR
ncbi:MAG: hypothetical protein AB1384_10600 [Actinomycetota bacterium]